MVGNGVANSPSVTDWNGYVPFLVGHGFISANDNELLNSTCSKDPNGNQCQTLLGKAYEHLTGIDIYDVYGPCFHQRPVDSKLKNYLQKFSQKDSQKKNAQFKWIHLVLMLYLLRIT